MFLPTKNSRSENQKSFLCEKNHFPFYGQVKKMLLGQIGKNGPKMHYQLHWSFFWLEHKIKNCFFCEKNHFWFSWFVKTNSDLADNEFLAHFCHYGPVTFFWPGHKTESDFFHIKMTFDFLSGHFWLAETCATVMTQTLFLIFVIRGCHGGI